MTQPGAGSDFYRMNDAGEMLAFSAADFEDFLEPRRSLPQTGLLAILPALANETTYASMGRLSPSTPPRLPAMLRRFRQRRRTSSPTAPRRLCLESLDERVVPSFSLVTDGSPFPYSAIVQIISVFPNQPAGQYFQGSGTIVDRFHVLTAGHLVYDASLGGYAKQITVYPGRTGATTPFGAANGIQERTFDPFIADDKVNSTAHAPGDGDVGLITLDRTLGDQTGWIPFAADNNDAFFAGQTFRKIGYPGDQGFSGRDMYAEVGPIDGAVPGVVTGFGALEWSTANLTSIAGESGSSLYYKDAQGNRTIYGVLETGGGGRGDAERITPTVWSTLTSWISQDTPPTSAVATTTQLAGTETATTLGQAVTFTATVLPASGTVLPAGSVEFWDGTTLLGTATLTLVHGVEQATLTTTSLAVGSHSITAQYRPATGFETSISPLFTVTVSPGAAAPGTSGFVIARDQSLWEFDPTGQWHELSGAGSVLAIDPGTDQNGAPVVYAITPDHSIWEDHAGQNGAVNWIQVSSPATTLVVRGAVGDTCFAVATDHSVWECDANGVWHELSNSSCATISAGTDASGNPVVYAVTTTGALWEDSAGATGQINWRLLAGDGSARDVHGGAGDICFAIAPDNSLWEESPGLDWQALAGAGSTLAISAGTDAGGNAVVFAVAYDHSLWQGSWLVGAAHWSNLAGAGSTVSVDGSLGGGLVCAITADNAVWFNNGAGHWLVLAGAGSADPGGYAGSTVSQTA